MKLTLYVIVEDIDDCTKFFDGRALLEIEAQAHARADGYTANSTNKVGNDDGLHNLKGRGRPDLAESQILKLPYGDRLPA